MARSYRILLAEDHVIFRELIKKSLKEIPDLEIVGEVSDGRELLDSVKTLKPQMILLDIGLPEMSGLDAAQTIKQQQPDLKILVLTMHKTMYHLSRALDVGVDGYLLKEDAFNDLLMAIDTIRGGKPYVSHLLHQQMLEKITTDTKKPVGSKVLSRRETEVLKLFGAGKSNLEIAASLGISPSTLRIHLSNIKKKLFIKSNTDLVRYAIKKGYAPVT
jgi:DNA-binding NarL/FixJ family response regulator